MALKICKMWSTWRWNVYFSRKKKIAQQLGMLEYLHFAQLATQLRHFSNKDILTLESSPPPSAKSCLHVCLWVCRGVESVNVQSVWVPPRFRLVPPHFICSGNGTETNPEHRATTLLFYNLFLRYKETKYNISISTITMINAQRKSLQYV